MPRTSKHTGTVFHTRFESRLIPYVPLVAWPLPALCTVSQNTLLVECFSFVLVLVVAEDNTLSILQYPFKTSQRIEKWENVSQAYRETLREHVPFHESSISRFFEVQAGRTPSAFSTFRLFVFISPVKTVYKPPPANRRWALRPRHRRQLAD